MFFHKDKTDFTPEQKNIIRVIEVLSGSMAGEGDKITDMILTARKLFRLSNFESSMFLFAIYFPGLFLFFSAYCLKPYYSNLKLTNIEGNKLFLVHNFIDSKLTILILITQLITIGESAIIFVDKPMLIIIKSIFKSLLKNIGISDEYSANNSSFRLKMNYFSRYFGKGCNSSEMIFYDSKIKENLTSTLKYLKYNKYNLILIPETPVENTKTMTFNCIGKNILIPKGLQSLSKYTSSIISLITDASNKILLPEIQVIIQKNDQTINLFSNIQFFINKYERLAFIHPELYLPFNIPSVWEHLYNETDTENIRIVNTMSLGTKNLVMLSDGQIYLGTRKEIKEVLYGFRAVMDSGYLL